MWENETVVLVTSIKKRLLGGNESVRFQRILTDNGIPTFIKDLFQKRVEEFITTESPFSVQATPHFSLQPDDLEAIRNEVQDVLQEAALFDQREVESVLREALVLRLDYLTKPFDTMRRLLFEKKDRVTHARMKEVLNPFSNILSYANEVLKTCHRQEKTSIDREEFEEIAADVRKRVVEEDPVRVVLREISALTEFLSETKGEEMTRVEGELLQEFMADRKLGDFRRAVSVEMKLGKESFDALELEMTLKRYLRLKEELSRTPPPEKKDSLEDSRSEEQLEKEALSDEEPPHEDKEWDLEEVLTEEALPLDMEAGKSKGPSKQESNPPQSIGIVREEKEDIEADVEERTRKSLGEMIDGKTEKVFVKKLFGGDATAYRHLADKLEEAESWRVAKVLIDNELFKRDVDPFSREAIKLVDLVYSRYYPEEGGGGKK